MKDLKVFSHLGRHPIWVSLIVIQSVFIGYLLVKQKEVIDFNLYDTYYLVSVYPLLEVWMVSVIALVVFILLGRKKSRF